MQKHGGIKVHAFEDWVMQKQPCDAVKRLHGRGVNIRNGYVAGGIDYSRDTIPRDRPCTGVRKEGMMTRITPRRRWEKVSLYLDSSIGPAAHPRWYVF
jgi:hypothetical protein